MVATRNAQLRILVADDEPMIRRLLQETLRLAGHTVDASESARDALRAWHEGAYDLLILDWVMGHQSGVEVAARIRDHGDPVPIIIMSGSSPGTDRLEGMGYALRFEILRKPFGVTDLREAVKRVLRRADEP